MEKRESSTLRILFGFIAGLAVLSSVIVLTVLYVNMQNNVQQQQETTLHQQETILQLKEAVLQLQAHINKTDKVGELETLHTAIGCTRRYFFLRI